VAAGAGCLGASSLTGSPFFSSAFAGGLATALQRPGRIGRLIGGLLSLLLFLGSSLARERVGPEGAGALASEVGVPLRPDEEGLEILLGGCPGCG